MSALADVLGPMIYNLLAWTVQAAVLALVAAMIGRVLPNSRGRLFFLQVVLLVGLVLPAVEPWSKPAGHGTGAVAIATGPAMVLDGAPSRFHFQWKPEYLLWLAAAGAVVRLLWILVGFARLRAYRNSAVRLDHPPVPFERGMVSWYVSDIVTSPVTFGWSRASILLPARVMELSDDLKEAIACHELIHVERRDWLFVLGEEILRALLWFQPGIWILLAEIQLAREQVVDGEVIRLMRDRERYLDALLAVATYKFQSDLAPAPLFLKKRHLAARVAMLLKENSMSKARICASFAGACSAAVVAAVVAIVFFPLQSMAQVPTRIAAVVSDGPGISVDTGAPLMHRTGVFRPAGLTTTGTVVIEATLDSKGEVGDARVLSGPDELRRAALQSVLQWHFANQPAPPASVQIRVSFAAVPAPEVRADVPSRESDPAPSNARTATLDSIQIFGASPELEQRVRASLPAHEGDPVVVTAYRNGAPVSGIMTEILAAARQIDEHFVGSLLMNRDGTATVRLTLVTPPPQQTGGVIAGLVNGADGAPPVLAPTPTTPTRIHVGSAVQQGTPSRIRVGGTVQQANLIRKVTPMYPPDAKEARVQGIVQLAVIIARDGSVASLEVVSGHPLLIQAAMDAVKQWLYKPTLLNGNPVEVVTTIDVTFTLSQ